MNNKNDGGSAFPQVPVHKFEYGNGMNTDKITNEPEGMTLRDYFAAHAPEDTSRYYDSMPFDPLKNMEKFVEFQKDQFAKSKYRYADAMIKAREL